jgi:hypothetical protein
MKTKTDELKDEKAETFKVKFIKDFEGHKAGEVLEVSLSNLVHFQEWDAIEK